MFRGLLGKDSHAAQYGYHLLRHTDLQQNEVCDPLSDIQPLNISRFIVQHATEPLPRRIQTTLGGCPYSRLLL